MPQLDPTPWLWMLLTTWAVIATLLMPEIIMLEQIMPPKLPPTITAGQMLPWVWPWP